MTEFKHALWGTQYGDFNINDPSGNNSLYLLKKGMERERIKIFFAPRVGFTNRIVKFGEDDKKVYDWLIRTRGEADGGIVEDFNQGIVFFNADCPIIAVYDLVGGRLAVLHGGFRCLVPERPKGKGKRDRSIIRVLFEDHKFDPKNSKVFFGYGIGPCCYGAQHLPELDDPTVDLPLGKATRGFRNGQKSLDLYMLIYSQLQEMKVLEANIFCDLTCTSCAGFNIPKYSSWCRDGPTMSGRNAALAWLK